MDSDGGFTPIETFVSFGRRNKRQTKKSTVAAEISGEPPAPATFQPTESNDTQSILSNPVIDNPAPRSPPTVEKSITAPPAPSAVPMASFGAWDDGFDEKATPAANGDHSDSGWGQSDSFFDSLASKPADSQPAETQKHDPFGFASSSDNVDFLSALSPADGAPTMNSVAPKVEAPPKRSEPIQPPAPKKLQEESVMATQQAPTAPAAKASAISVFDFGSANHAGEGSSPFDSLASSWGMESHDPLSLGKALDPAPQPAAVAPPPKEPEKSVSSNEIAQTITLATQSAPEPSLPTAIAAPPPSSGSSRSSGGRGRRQMADFSAMMQGGSPPAVPKSREPPMPSPTPTATLSVQPREPPAPTPAPTPVAMTGTTTSLVTSVPPVSVPVSREPPMPAPKEPVSVPSQAAAPVPLPAQTVSAHVPLQPPPSVGIDPPPARGSDAGGPPSRRAKKSAAERASQMYGTAAPQPTASIPVVNPLVVAPTSALSVLPSVSSTTLLPPSHPQPIPVSEPVHLDDSAEMFNEAPPRPSWAGLVASPAPLTRTPEPADTPETRHKVFDMFGGSDSSPSSSSSEGADFFGKLSAAATEIDLPRHEPPMSATPEPQLPSMSFGSPELTTVSLTPTTTPAPAVMVVPSPSVSEKPNSSHRQASRQPAPFVATSVSTSQPFSMNGGVKATNAGPKITFHEPPTTPSTPSKPQPSAEAPTSSAFNSRMTASTSSEATQSLLQKAGELEAMQRQLVRAEREKEDLSRTHDVLIQRFRDLEVNYHKLQRDQRDLRSKAEEAFLEIEASREAEKELRRERDDLQSQILSLSQQLRQNATANTSSLGAASQQEIFALQRDNEQLRRAVEQLSKANDVLQARVAGMGVSGISSSTTTLATFEQAVAGVKQQYEERLRIMQKKIEALLVNQQRAELEMEDLKIQKRDADTRVAQVEKFAGEDRQALQNKLAALQQRALTAEHKLASVVGANNASATTASAPDTGVIEEQRKALDKLTREFASMEQRCVSLDALLSQVSRERDSVVASLGEAQQKNSLLVSERAQLAAYVEKLKLDLDSRARASSSDAIQEALRKAQADRDSVAESLKKQGSIMQNLMEENAKLISTVDFYKQVSKESRDVSVIEQLHRDKNVLLKTIADLSSEIEDLKRNRPKQESSPVVANNLAPTTTSTPVQTQPIVASTTQRADPRPAVPAPTASVSKPEPPIVPPTSTPTFSFDPELFKPTDLKASAEFSLRPTTRTEDSSSSLSSSTAPSALSMMSSVTALASATPSVVLSAPSTTPPPSRSPVGAPATIPTISSAPPTTSLSAPAAAPPTLTSTAPLSTSVAPPPARPSIEPPPIGTGHTEENSGSGKRRQRHIAFVSTASMQTPGAGMVAPSPFGATLPPAPASSVFVPTAFVPAAPVSSGPLVEAGAPPPSITSSSMLPPPKRGSPSVAKRAAASTGVSVIPGSAFGAPATASPLPVPEPDYDRVQTGSDEPPMMDVDTGPSSPNGYSGGSRVETGTPTRGGNFWGSVWKTVTLQ